MRWGLLVLMLLLAGTGCRGGGDRPSAPAAGAARSPAAPAAAATALEVADWSAFGLPVPTGAVLEERASSHAYYLLDAPLQAALAFFDSVIPDFVQTRYDQGVKLDASDRSGRTIYLYGSQRGTLLTYFDGPSAVREEVQDQAPRGNRSDRVRVITRSRPTVAGTRLPVGVSSDRVPHRMNPMPRREVNMEDVNFNRGRTTRPPGAPRPENYQEGTNPDAYF